MSRSYKKTPIVSFTCSESEKKDKKAWHSRVRATERDRLRTSDYENHLTTLDSEKSNVWDMSKDGKHYWEGAKKKDMRK
jgi:hypothetical protein